MTRLLLVAGDPSGDLYGSLLIKALARVDPKARIDAMGGPLMRRALKEPGRFLFDLASLGVTGFVEPARRIPTFLGLRRRLAEILERERPDALVCIDFYGFNRHVLALAKAAGVTALYFISPQVWASRPGRVRQLKRLVDRMLVIFPFEERLYREAGVPVTWVGHPLLDLLPEPDGSAWSTADGAPPRVGLLPGSRPSEVRRHMPVLAAASALILRDFPRAEFLLFAAAALPDRVYAPWLEEDLGPSKARLRLVRETDYSQRARLHLALTSSGTATLENALLGVPMVVLYKLSWPTYLVARALIRVPHIAMANLLAGKKLVPELIQHEATGPRVARAALDMLGSPRRLTGLRRELLALREQLGGPGAVDRAAGIILREAVSRRRDLAKT